MTASNIAYLNIGTNQGHRQSNLDRAVALLHRYLPDSTIRTSDIVTSAPWGFDSPNPFLNIGVCLTTTLAPEPLLDLLQQIEREISPSPHRDSTGGYIDRVIDIDLIAMTAPEGRDYIIRTPRLTLPHPRMHLRDFVLIPMSQIAPDWIHPTLHLTVARLLLQLQQRI